MELINPAFSLLAFDRPPRLARRMRPRRCQIELLEMRQVFDGTFTLVNHTQGYADGKFAYLDTEIRVAMYGQDSTSTNWYYFDQTGAAHSTTGLGSVPSYTLNQFHNVSPHHYTVTFPETLTGSSYGPNAARIVFFVDPTFQVTINGNGSVNAPAPKTSQFYDFVEFTYNAPNNPTGNLNINTSTIDQFGFPITVDVDGTTVGVIANRDQVIQQYQQTFPTGDPYALGVWNASDPVWGPYRLTNPADVMENAQVAINKLQTDTFLLDRIEADTEILHVNANGFPNPATDGAFTVWIKNEKVTVNTATKLADGTTNWTVTRGVDGTTPAFHVVGAWVTPVGPAIDATQTTLTVQNTLNFPPYPFPIKVGEEIMIVTSLVGVNSGNGTTTWNVLRGQYGTTATFHVQNAIVYCDTVTAMEFNSYYNTAIDALFTKYQNNPTDKLVLPFVPPGTQTTQLWEGVTTTDSAGRYVLQFSQQGVMNSPTYNVYYPFFHQNKYYWGEYTPLLPVGFAPPFVMKANAATLSPSEMVFACNGVFADNTFRPGLTTEESKLVGALENQIVAALNRGVALLKSYDAVDPTNTWADASRFYNTSQPYNKYAEFMHNPTISQGGLAYGFAYDDQGGHASDIGVDSFTSVTITLGNWGDLPPSASFVGPSLRYFLASTFGIVVGSSSSSGASESFSTLSGLSLEADPAPAPLAALDAALDELADEHHADDAEDLFDPADAIDHQQDDEDDDFVAPVATPAPIALPTLRAFLASRGRVH